MVQPEGLASRGDGDGARAARGSLDRYLDETLDELGIPPTEYALAGFSQGAMMALFAGLRRPVPPRAILAYAGVLLAPTELASEITNRARVLLVHGEDDDVVPPKPRASPPTCCAHSMCRSRS